MRWTVFGVLAALLVAVGLVLLLSERDGGGSGGDVLEHGDEGADTPSAPRLHGVEGAVAPGATDSTDAASAGHPSDAGREVHGVVVGADGRPVPGANVFVIPKEHPEDGEVRVERQVFTDAEGVFTLEKVVLRGRWLGVVAPHHLPAHRDGEELPNGEDVRVALEAGPRITVRVRGVDGGPLELDTIVLVRGVGEEGSAFPAPGEPWAYRYEVEVPPGVQEQAVRLSGTGPATVEADYRHTWSVVDPDDEVEVSGGDTVVFTVSPSCVLDFRVFDASTGDPLPRGFSYSRLVDGEPTSGGSWGLPGGRNRVNIRIRPGTYAFRVWATGYRPQTSEVVTLAAPGDEAVVEVRLEPDPTRGNLRISLPALPELPRRTGPEGEYVAPAFFLWMRPTSLAAPWERDFGSGGAWGSLEGESRRESDTDYLFEGVPEGEVALLVGEAVSGRIALVTGVRIRGGKTDTTTVDLREGIRFDPRTLVPTGRTCRSFRIRHSVHGELPTWSFGVMGSYWLDPGEVPHGDSPVGPYPGPEIEVEVVLDDGTKKTRRFP